MLQKISMQWFKTKNEAHGLQSVGKVDPTLFEQEFGKLKTCEVVLTPERKMHVKERHPKDYSLLEKYGNETISDPDMILKDRKNPKTVFMIKKLENTNLNVIVRLALGSDGKDKKNSIMTFYRIRDSNLKKLAIKNKELYRRNST